MVHGADTILLPKVRLCFLRIEHFDDVDQDEDRKLDVNLYDEARDAALAHVHNQASLGKHYDKKVVHRSLEVGDLVLKKDIRTIDKKKYSS